MEERNQRDKEVQEKKILVEQRVEPLATVSACSVHDSSCIIIHHDSMC